MSSPRWRGSADPRGGEPSAVAPTCRHPRAPRRRTQQERSAESRDRLIEATIRLLAERGYAGTSLAEIGRASGLSRGLVTHHFGSKEACVRAVIKHIQHRVRSRMGALRAGDAPALEQLLDVYLDGVRNREPGVPAMYVILVERITASPGLGPEVAEANAHSRSFIERLLREATDPEQEPVGAGPPVETIAVMVEALLRGVAVQWMADPSEVDLDESLRMAKEMIRGAVAGLRT